MIQIGIDLNGVIRDLNKNYLKYYTKDIDPNFEEENVDLKKTSILEDLPFKSKEDRRQFVYEDYPFEIFGCSPAMSRNLHTFLNGWIYNKYWDDEVEVGIFALDEDELTIQSTFHYLSKSGTRVRKVILPIEPKAVFDEFDVVITANKKLLKDCPKNNTCVFIRKSDTQDVKAELSYDNLEDIFRDNEFIEKVTKQPKSSNIFNKLINRVKKWLRNM